MTAKFTVVNQGRFKLPKFGVDKMTALGQKAIALNLARWDKGLNVYDAPAKPLQIERPFKVHSKTGEKIFIAPSGYAVKKRRKTGSNIRDLRLTGALRSALGILSVREGRVEIGWPAGPMRDRARFNQRVEFMFGTSPNDERALREFTGELLGGDHAR